MGRLTEREYDKKMALLESKKESPVLDALDLFGSNRTPQEIKRHDKQVAPSTQSLNELLFYASGKNYIDDVVLLVDLGADPNKKDRYGNAPLHNAVKVKNLKLVKYLLEVGADVNAVNSRSGNTALHYAGRESNASVVKVLQDAGAKSDIKNISSDLPLEEVLSSKLTTQIEKAVSAFSGIPTRDRAHSRRSDSPSSVTKVGMFKPRKAASEAEPENDATPPSLR